MSASPGPHEECSEDHCHQAKLYADFRHLMLPVNEQPRDVALDRFSAQSR